MVFFWGSGSISSSGYSKILLEGCDVGVWVEGRRGGSCDILYINPLARNVETISLSANF
jgi:hypothetical protein